MDENELYNASLKLLKPLNTTQTYKTIVNEAVNLVKNAYGGSLILARRGIMERVYTTDPRIKDINPQKHGRTYKAYRDKKVMVLTKESITEVHPEFSKLKITSYILVPLINQGNSIGVLSIYKGRGSKFSPAEIGTLRQYCTLASMAIRKSQLYTQLNNAVSVRNLFISMASHELRTPVTTMYVYMQLLERKIKKGEPVDPEWINTLLYETARLTKLIDELLRVNQIKAGKFTYEFEEIEIIDVIRKTLSSFRANHQTTKVILENALKENLKVIGDQDKLIQVILNLLDNAAKHNQWEKPIYLKLSLVNKMIKITVEDNGTGIPKEDQKHLFEEFFKGHDHTKSGMGLGLFVVKKILDKHKGKIKVFSKEGSGTKVDIYLPVISYE